MKHCTASSKKCGSDCCPGANKKLYLLAFLIMALSAMIWISGCNTKVVKESDSAGDVAADYNLELTIPPENNGELEKIPPEKIDSLFSNLKK